MELVQVRQDFEEGRISKELLKKLYSQYNPNIKDIDTFLEQAQILFPKLNCGLATVYLQHLVGGKVVQGKYKGQSHTFLLKENKIFDITADQFGGPKVYEGEIQAPWKL